jgi:hypothetical protein
MSGRRHAPRLSKMDLGKALLGEESPLLPSWEARMKMLLWEGDVDATLKEAMACIEDVDTSTQVMALNSFVKYCRDNAHRMRYRDFAAAGLLIGSGPVESGHRHVFQERMKKSGQHWSIPGARRMARLRAHYRTAGPKRFYAAIRWAHRESERLPIRTPSKRRRASNR